MLKLEARPQPSTFWSYGSPILALLITVLIGVVMFVALGKDPLRGLEMFFWLPIKSGYAVGELLVKATPLLIIAKRPVDAVDFVVVYLTCGAVDILLPFDISLDYGIIEGLVRFTRHHGKNVVVYIFELDLPVGPVLIE